MTDLPNKTVKEPLVSILTPVYNGEKYLADCIESVLDQTYSNWEYVIVNNGSTDSSLEIAKSYAEKESRIRIHDNDRFLTQMENLNHAFRQISSKSKYCKVLHADDLLFPDCVKRMVELSESHPSIGIVSSYQIIGDKIRPNGLAYPRNVISGKEIGRRYLLNNEFHCVAHPSAILIRSDLIHKRERIYDETYLDSDSTAFLKMLSESDFGFVYQALTFTRLHEDSVTSDVNIYMHLLGVYRIYLDSSFLFLKNEEAKSVIKKREKIFYIQFARSMITGDSKKVFQNLSKELISNNIPLKYGKLTIAIVREFFNLGLKKIGIKITKV